MATYVLAGLVGTLDGSAWRCTVTMTHTYDEPGTYFPALRVAAQREGRLESPHARVLNLGRARVVVSQGAGAVLDEDIVARLSRHWDEGWNGADLEVIMAPFAEGVVFSSPFIPRLTGDPGQATIEGRDALRAYLAASLDRAADVRYTLDRVLTGAETLVLVYRCHLPDGSTKPGADVMRVDATGEVVEWRCHYATDPTAWRD